MENTKQCPYCAEWVDSKANICKHCQGIMGGGEIEKKGVFIKVRLKVQEKVYHGDIFVPHHLCRVSDVINDGRHFLLLSNAKEETKSSEIPIGFLALNKNVVEWIRLIGQYD